MSFKVVVLNRFCRTTPKFRFMKMATHLKQLIDFRNGKNFNTVIWEY